MEATELFELQKENLKNQWVREAGKLMNVIRDLELELRRMKEKKLPEDFITAKDNQINTLVDFYNSSNTIINSYQMQVTYHRMNDKLNSELFKRELNAEARTNS